ncbi:unnamed protein product, partial [Mycena citricolor]
RVESDDASSHGTAQHSSTLAQAATPLGSRREGGQPAARGKTPSFAFWIEPIARPLRHCVFSQRFVVGRTPSRREPEGPSRTCGEAW